MINGNIVEESVGTLADVLAVENASAKIVPFGTPSVEEVEMALAA